jgi:hypothetical protein
VDGKGAGMSEIILTDKLIRDWLDEIPNMRKVTDNYPSLAALSMSVVFEVLELSLKELASLRSRIAELEALIGSQYPDKDWEEAHLEIEAQLRTRIAELEAELTKERLMRERLETSGMAAYRENKILTTELRKAQSLLGSILTWFIAFKEKYPDGSVDEKYLELTAYTKEHD